MPSGNDPLSRADERDSGGNGQSAAGHVADQAQQSAQQAAGQVQDRLREQIDQRSSQAAEQINQQVSDLRAVSGALREQGKDGPAQAADRLAGYAERIGGYLREKDSNALLADAEDFGRRRPWAAAAGGMALGFAASRFLKASSTQRYQTRTAGPAPQPVSVTDATATPPALPARAPSVTPGPPVVL